MPISTNLRTAIERASHDTDAWAPLCDRLAEEFDGLGTLLIPIDKTHRAPWLTVSESLIPVLTDYLANGWSTQDLREQGLDAGRKRGYIIDSDIGTEEELNTLPYYRELLRPHGIGGVCAILFNVNDTEWAMAIQLPIETYVPTDAKLALIPEIRILIENAAEKCGKSVNRLWSSYFQTMSFSGDGLAVLDGTGRMVKKNSEFDAIRANLRGKGSEFKFPDPFTEYCLKLFCETGKITYKPAPYLLSEGEPSIICTVSRIPENMRLFSTESVAVVTLSEYSSFDEDLKVVMASRFDLVPSEVELVLRLSKGMNLKDSAIELGIKEGTARQRLKSIFQKTDSQTQHQLVSKVLRARALPLKVE